MLLPSVHAVMRLPHPLYSTLKALGLLKQKAEWEVKVTSTGVHLVMAWSNTHTGEVSPQSADSPKAENPSAAYSLQGDIEKSHGRCDSEDPITGRSNHVAAPVRCSPHTEEKPRIAHSAVKESHIGDKARSDCNPHTGEKPHTDAILVGKNPCRSGPVSAVGQSVNSQLYTSNEDVCHTGKKICTYVDTGQELHVVAPDNSHPQSHGLRIENDTDIHIGEKPHLYSYPELSDESLSEYDGDIDSEYVSDIHTGERHQSASIYAVMSPSASSPLTGSGENLRSYKPNVSTSSAEDQLDIEYLHSGEAPHIYDSVSDTGVLHATSTSHTGEKPCTDSVVDGVLYSDVDVDTDYCSVNNSGAPWKGVHPIDQLPELSGAPSDDDSSLSKLNVTHDSSDSPEPSSMFHTGENPTHFPTREESISSAVGYEDLAAVDHTGENPYTPGYDYSSAVHTGEIPCRSTVPVADSNSHVGGDSVLGPAHSAGAVHTGEKPHGHDSVPSCSLDDTDPEFLGYRVTRESFDAWRLHMVSYLSEVPDFKRLLDADMWYNACGVLSHKVDNAAFTALMGQIEHFCRLHGVVKRSKPLCASDMWDFVYKMHAI